MQKKETRLSRRMLLRGGALSLTSGMRVADSEAAPAVTFAALTDLHYADKPPAGSRHYRDTIPKLREALASFKEARVDFLVELGDCIDQAPDVITETGYLKRILTELRRLHKDTHYVLGNHCVSTLTKAQFQAVTGRSTGCYSFNRRGFHFVVLDACFRADGVPYGGNNFDWKDSEIPPEERDWLRADLSKTDRKTVVFVHQRIDVGPPFGIRSAGEVRSILEQSGKVLAAFQGHEHPGAYSEIGGIHYCTLSAMVEGAAPEANAYSVVRLYPSGELIVEGRGNQRSYRIARGRRFP
jgi:Calcineurin-like phosphoesterase